MKTYQNNSVKILSFIFFCLINIGVLSSCFCQNVYINNQEDVNNFASDYPGVSKIQTLHVNGEDITDLSGLSQLNKIEIQLAIQSTSLLNLHGLHNLNEIGVSDVENVGILILINEKLTSLQALESISFPNDNSTIVIGHNKSLDICNQPFICNFLENHSNILIANNGLSCSDRQTLLTNCDIEYDLANKEQILENGFENWNDTLPNNFQYYQNFYSSVDPSVNQVNSITEGDFAVSLIDNLILLDSPVSPIIYTTIPGTSNKINFEFDCSCIGYGQCEIFLLQKEKDEEKVSLRSIWKIFDGDSTIYKMQFNDVSVSNGFDEIVGIGFFTSSDLFFPENSTEFIIDNLKVYEEKSTSNYIVNEEVNLFPNPTSDRLTIKIKKDLGTFHLLDVNGKLLEEYSNQHEINLEAYPSGLYFIKFQNEKSPFSLKIIKL